jgi:hypothetical protein
VATTKEVKANVDVMTDGCYMKTTFDGALSLQRDEPYPGAVTMLWQPSKEYPGKSVEVIIPADLFLPVILAYARENEFASGGKTG